MSGIFPIRDTVTLDDERGPRLVELDDEVADEVFDALSSRTTREIFAQLHSSPQAASDLADVTDTSVQNAQYHLEKLIAADLVEVVDTWYSERGTEMKVYAPTDEALVLFAGNDKQSTFRSLLKRLVGILAVLFPMSAAVAWLANQVQTRQSGEFATREGDPSGQQVAQDGASGDAGALAADSPTPAESPSGGVDQGARQPVEEDAEAADQPTDATSASDESVATETGDATEGSAGGGDGGSGGSGGSDGGSGGGGGGDGGDGGVSIEATDTPQATPDGVQPQDTPQEATPMQTATPEEPSVVTDGGTTNVTADAGDPMGVTPTPENAPDQETIDAAVDAAGGIDPWLLGLAFFLGGLFALSLVGVAWYWRS